MSYTVGDIYIYNQHVVVVQYAYLTMIESICFPHLLLLIFAGKKTGNRSSAAYLHRRLHEGRHVCRPVKLNVVWLPRMGRANVEVVKKVLTADNI